MSPPDRECQTLAASACRDAEALVPTARRGAAHCHGWMHHTRHDATKRVPPPSPRPESGMRQAANAAPGEATAQESARFAKSHWLAKSKWYPASAAAPATRLQHSPNRCAAVDP